MSSYDPESSNQVIRNYMVSDSEADRRTQVFSEDWDVLSSMNSISLAVAGECRSSKFESLHLDEGMARWFNKL